MAGVFPSTPPSTSRESAPSAPRCPACSAPLILLNGWARCSRCLLLLCLGCEPEPVENLPEARGS